MFVAQDGPEEAMFQRTLAIEHCIPTAMQKEPMHAKCHSA